MCNSNFSFRNKFIIFLPCGLLVNNNTVKNCAYLKVKLATDDGDYENQNVCFTNNKIKDNVGLRSLN